MDFLWSRREGGDAIQELGFRRERSVSCIARLRGQQRIVDREVIRGPPGQAFWVFLPWIQSPLEGWQPPRLILILENSADVRFQAVVSLFDKGMTMAQYTPFLNIYVVWHPAFSCSEVSGVAIAETLYREFCRNPDLPMSPAIGAPVYFRTSRAEGLAPTPIDLDGAEYNVVAFLVDSSMVLDEVYQKYAAQIAAAMSDGRRHRVLSFLWPDSGALRLGNTQQIPLSGDDNSMLATVRMKLAAETCRLLQNRPRMGPGSTLLSPEPPMLFISHAKRDAEDKAEEIKVLVEKTPIDTFFDRVDIAAGFDFTSEILENIKRSTVLAWQSDEYGSRPWCNIELLTAKEYLRPIVVVLGVKSGEERSFPYLGNVRTIVANSDNSSEIIIAAIREYLRKLFTEGRFESLVASGMIPRTRFRLFRPPEPIDGALLQRKARHVSTDPGKPDEIAPSQAIYPDPPLGTAEIKVLSRLFPELDFVTPTTIEGRSLNGLKVALSISECDDLSDLGQSQAHLLSAMIEIARHILTRGGTIAYGGDLREKKQYGFTRQLLQLIYAYKDLNRPPLERIWSFLAYHVAAELPKKEEAKLLELARFEKILPANIAAGFHLNRDFKLVIPDDSPDHRYVRARCLTAMREAMAATTDARIVIGGRVSGHQGKYPGILEEASLVLGSKPLYLIGAFGGCARLLILALRDKHAPEALTPQYQTEHPRIARYQAADGTARAQSVPFDELDRTYRDHIADPLLPSEPIDYKGVVNKFQKAKIEDLRNGLDQDENNELFVTSDLDRIVTLLVKGLEIVATAKG